MFTDGGEDTTTKVSAAVRPNFGMVKVGRLNQEASLTTVKSISLYTGKKTPMIRVNT